MGLAFRNVFTNFLKITGNVFGTRGCVLVYPSYDEK